MADDDVAAERARLERAAWGADSTPAEAARARIALGDLERGARGRRTVASPGSRPVASPGSRTGGAEPVRPRTLRSAGGSPPHEAATGSPARASGADGPGTDPVGGGSGDRIGDDVGVGVGPRADPETDGAVRDRDDARLPETGTTDGRPTRAPWSGRSRVWIAAASVAAVGVAFGAGTLVGTAGVGGSPSAEITPTAGAVTLEQLLDAPQTYADRLPGPLEAPVSLHTTRLVFTNRALDGSAFETPWNVWAGVGTDRSTICLVATADRTAATTACYPREQALHGAVSLSAQSRSGTMTLTLRGGGVQGTVTNEN